jgi:chromosome segregation ATPase
VHSKILVAFNVPLFAVCRCDVSEEASKAAKLRAEKAEEEVLELVAKARQLETELDLTSEKLALITLQLEEKEKSLMASEAEMNALNRRVQGLEEDLEKNEEKLLVANQKLDKVRNKLKTVQLTTTFRIVYICFN